MTEHTIRIMYFKYITDRLLQFISTRIDISIMNRLQDILC